jgi:hypothetical protein
LFQIVGAVTSCLNGFPVPSLSDQVAVVAQQPAVPWVRAPST